MKKKKLLQPLRNSRIANSISYSSVLSTCIFMTEEIDALLPSGGNR